MLFFWDFLMGGEIDAALGYRSYTEENFVNTFDPLANSVDDLDTLSSPPTPAESLNVCHAKTLPSRLPDH